MWKRLIYRGEDLGDYYEISDNGQIRNALTKSVRKNNINHEGYYFVSISLGSRERKRTIKNHMAVADTFLDNPYNLPVINHKDGNKLNNDVDNLEWCTYQYNTLHAKLTGLIDYSKIYRRKIICVSTGKVYESVMNAAKEYQHCSKNNMLETTRKRITDALKKNGKAYGVIWKYCE